MKIVKFEDIISWQKAQDLAIDIYETFEKNRDFDFNRQIFRSVISISNNISEGFDRSYTKEFERFFYIALPSNSEVKSKLHLAYRLKFISDTKKIELIENLQKYQN